MIRRLFSLSFILLFSLAAMAALSENSRSILNEAAKLKIETQRDAVVRKLKALPEQKVYEALRDGLKEKEYVYPAARAAMAIEMKRLVPDLRAYAEKNESWEVFGALATLSEGEEKHKTEKFFTTRFPSVTTPSKLLILQALGDWKPTLAKDTLSSMQSHCSAEIDPNVKAVCGSLLEKRK